MPKKQTVIDKASDVVQDLADDAVQATQHIGVVAMTTAALISMVGHDETKKVVLPAQPVFAYAGNNSGTSEAPYNNVIRREKENEDSGRQEVIGYSVAQRTPSRSGKH